MGEPRSACDRHGSSPDRTVKRTLYESTGVLHYLIVDPVAKTIQWLALSVDGRYHDRSVEVLPAGRFEVMLPDGCRIGFDQQTTFA